MNFLTTTFLLHVLLSYFLKDLFEESREELEDFSGNMDRAKEQKSELVDTSMFNGAVLPVTCGSTIAALHKCRFAGR